MTEHDEAPDARPRADESARVVLTPPAGQEQFVEPPAIEPQTPATQADKGTKLFVLFFFLLVPPLGVILLAAVCWTLFKKFLAT